MSKDSKKKKNVRNRGRDALLDYYKTNREITKEYDKIYEEEKAARKAEGKGRPGWTGNEKFYLGVILVGIVLIAIKYLVF